MTVGIHKFDISAFDFAIWLGTCYLDFSSEFGVFEILLFTNYISGAGYTLYQFWATLFCSLNFLNCLFDMFSSLVFNASLFTWSWFKSSIFQCLYSKTKIKKGVIHRSDNKARSTHLQWNDASFVCYRPLSWDISIVWNVISMISSNWPTQYRSYTMYSACGFFRISYSCQHNLRKWWLAWSNLTPCNKFSDFDNFSNNKSIYIDECHMNTYL